MSFERVRGFLTKELVDVEKLPRSSPQIIVGIGSETGKILKEQNVKNVKKLSQQDSKTLNQLTGIRRSQIERWISAAKILVAIGKGDVSDRKKIVLAGLDNAGKTSMIQTLTTGCVPVSLNHHRELIELGPTEGLQREEMSLFGWVQADIYDLGGLERYRMRYFEEKVEVFSQTDLLIFIIDAQDHGRYNAALDYLDIILEVYSSLGEIPYTAVFLNKWDAEISESPEYEERLELLKKSISKLFRKYRFDRFHIDNTSVFEAEKLFLSFSTALRKITNAYPVIEGILREYGELLGSKDLMLFDDKALLIAEYTSNYREILSATTMRMIWLRETLTDNYSLNASTITVELGPNEIIVCKPTDWEDKTVYLSGVLPSTEKSSVLNILGEELQPWIRNIGII
ncbi:MAG: ADP-ribosylation factor-like protein [Candidatus Lokiarchaeia archaeon]